MNEKAFGYLRVSSKGQEGGDGFVPNPHHND